MTVTTKTYRRDRVIYVMGDVAFVANPETRSCWWKTHVAVALVACPSCKAPVGQLCAPSFGFHRGNTHGERKNAARRHAPVTMKVVVQEEGSP
jgi:hypothetical protein